MKRGVAIALVGLVLAAWATGVLLAITDGTILLEVTTPLITMLLGWALTAKVGG